MGVCLYTSPPPNRFTQNKRATLPRSDYFLVPGMNHFPANTTLLEGFMPSDASLRRRTRQLHPLEGKVCPCGKPAQVRHHRNGQLHDNEAHNIQFLCRGCHVEMDPKIVVH